MSEQSEVQRQARGWNPINYPLRNTIIFSVLILLAIFTCLYIWGLNPFFRSQVSTTNAYIQGRTTTISPQISGYVKAVKVNDFAEVKRGDVLVEIDPANYRALLEQAVANEAASKSEYDNADHAIASAQAELSEIAADIKSAEASQAGAEIDFDRLSRLVESNAATQSDYDHAQNSLKEADADLAKQKAAYQVAEATLRSAEVNKLVLKANWDSAIAQRKQAEINMMHTQIVAPRDGKLSTIGVREGAYVTAGTALMYLVPKVSWVLANFKENDTANIKVGQKASFKVDALNGKEFTAKVTEISPATGAEFSVVATNHATGNFVKVIQRVPIKIELDPSDQEGHERLLPGLSVEAFIDTSAEE